MDMEYKETLRNLNKYWPKGIWKSNEEFGLDKFRFFLRKIGNPQNKLEFIHVAGTSGKGSTATFLAEILKESGYKTGLITSPDVYSIRERIRINGKKIEKEKFIDLYKKIKGQFGRVEKKYSYPPSFFEILMAIGFEYFYQEKCQVVVLETGIGGKLDSSNVVRCNYQIITNIGLDHTQILGKTKKSILLDKQEIIKNKSIVVSGIKECFLKKIINEKVQETRSKITFLGTDFGYKIRQKNKFDFWFGKKTIKNLKTGMKGLFQLENTSMAVMMSLNLLKKFKKINTFSIKKGLSKAYLPARFEIISNNPIEIWDGAHNVEKTKALVESVKYYYPKKKFVVLFKDTNREDKEKIIRELKKIGLKIFIVNNDKLRETYRNIKKYCLKNKTGFLVTGSFFIMKDILKENE